MFIVILGSGRIGALLAKHLVGTGHEISVIDWDSFRCSSLDVELGSVSVLGNGTNRRVLEKAGANRAQCFIATTSRDEDNLVACQIALHEFQISNTVSVVNHQERCNLFTQIGIHSTIDVTNLAVNQIQELVFEDPMVRILPLPGYETQTLVAIRVPRESPMNGRPLKELDLPSGALISLVIDKHHNAVIPEDSSIIEADTEILAVAKSQDQDTLRNMFLEQFGDSG